MGRAINMENELERVKVKTEQLEKAVTTCIYKIEGFEDTIKTILLNIEATESEGKNDKKKANNKGAGKGNKRNDSTNRTVETKNK